MIAEIRKRIRESIRYHEETLNEVFYRHTEEERYNSIYWRERNGIIQGLRSALDKVDEVAGKGEHKGEAKAKLKEDIIKAIVRCQEKHDCNGCPYNGKSHCIEKLLNDCKRVIKGEKEKS